MSQELAVTESRPPAPQEPMFGRALGRTINEGTVDIEGQRAIAEAQGKLVVAQRFRRDEQMAFARMQQACRRPGLAEQAFYNYSRAGSKVEGLSIRAAEELARIYGNITYGLRELSQGVGYSEMQAFAHDLENNVESVQNFTVKHRRDVSGGAGKELTSERDIYEITANMGARRMRARILAILPADFVDAAIAECKKTMAGDNTVPLVDRIRAALAAFEHVGVTAVMLAAKLGHPLDKITPDELVDLRGTLKALKDGQTTVAEEFGAKVDTAAEAIVATAGVTKPPAQRTRAAKPPETPPAQTAPEAAKPLAIETMAEEPAALAALAAPEPSPPAAAKANDEQGDVF